MAAVQYTPLEDITLKHPDEMEEIDDDESERGEERRAEEGEDGNSTITDEEAAAALWPLPWQQRKPQWPTLNIYTMMLAGAWVLSLIFVYALTEAYRGGHGGGRGVQAMQHHTGKIAKISMLYGKHNQAFERAMDSHQRHADRWNYPFFISREDGDCGFWNKPVFILSMLTAEMAKPPSQRIEWLMWVDADTIILNDNIPCDIFLPPPGPKFEHIHMIAGRDWNGLNTGVFFLRVGEWAIDMLIQSLAYPLCKPDKDLGRNKDQVSMATILESTSGGPRDVGFATGKAYVPRSWFNDYERPPWSYNQTHDETMNEFPGSRVQHLYEGDIGHFLVHLPGIGGDDRKKLMADWEDLIEGDRAGLWARPLSQTPYPEKTRRYWEQYGNAVDVYNEAKALRSSDRSLSDAMRKLTVALAEDADDGDAMHIAVSVLKMAIKKSTGAPN